MPKSVPVKQQLSRETSGTESLVHIQQSKEILNKRFSHLGKYTPVQQQDQENSDTEEDMPAVTSIAREFLNTKYECLRPTPLISPYNQELIMLLQLLEKQRELNMEDKNALSYRHAIAAIKAYPRKLQSVREAEKIIGIGKKMTTLIRAYLATGHVLEAEQLLMDERFQTLRLFNKAFGVGPSTAKLWWDMGYRTLQEVLDNAQLTTSVRLAIELLPDLIQPMTRDDVKELVDIIQREVIATDKEAFVTPVGGYRRGKEENGDLDVLISSKSSTVGLLSLLVQSLIKKGYIRHKLWYSDANAKVTGHKLHNKKFGSGVHRRIMDGLDKCFAAFLQPSKGVLRQVDIIVVAPEEYATAILGWTGSRQFERSIRDYASKEKNMTVNSQSIHINTVPRQQLTVETEEQAFEIIGVPWLEPEMRNC
ncbi:hypothetical protein DFQ28_003895 [Apophysomyces sp. BC1034]|nr:hypothetical protein DFQ29_009857 [Apophysomyces sp. BC1021]KAG0189097.1 hypothetical protein DFQ28_003895 [Apophysomyces sp. BC1034]